MAASRHPIRWRAKIWWREAREALSGQAHQKELTVKDKTISEKDSEILRLKDQLAAMSEKRDLEMNAAVTEKKIGRLPRSRPPSTRTLRLWRLLY